MSRNLKKYTYENFLKTGKVLDKYYDEQTKVVICSNFIQLENKKDKKIFIDLETKKVKIEF